MIRRLAVAIVAVGSLLSVALAQSALASSVHIYDEFVKPGTKPVDWGKGAQFDYTPGDASDDSVAAIPEQTQAGAPVSLSFGVQLCEGLGERPNASGPDTATKLCNPTTEKPFDFKDLAIDLPAGMIGNANATPLCEESELYANACPPESLVGWIGAHGEVQGATEDFTVPANGWLYNVRPSGGEVAKLGAAINPQGNPTLYIPTFVRLREEDDFGISSLSLNNPNHLLASSFVDGITEPPADAQGPKLKVADLQVSLFAFAGEPTDGSIDHPPFLRMPTTCTTQDLRLGVNSYDDAIFEHISLPITPTGCDAGTPPFDPGVDMKPTDSSQAGAASGYEIGIQFPTGGEDVGVHQSHMKRAEVTLPADVGLNPAAANKLDACSDEQFGAGVAAPSQCPENSKIGDVEVTAPVVDGDNSTPELDPLTGSLYFGQPRPGEQWPLLLEIEDAGVRVKLHGHADIDEQTGRITNVFDNLPQVPFERFEIKLRGGSRSILANPSTCGSHQITATFTPWNEAHANVTTTGDFEITGNGVPGNGCGSPPFGPSFAASSDTEQAGAFTKSHLSIAVPERNQRLRNLDLNLPAGLLGSLTKTASCSVNVARAGGCAADSQIGRLAVSLGTGAETVSIPGRIHLADPLQAGDAASLAIIVPNKVGPIDLGTLTIMSRVVLRGTDGGLDVLAEDLPSVYRGVPIEIRNITIDVDRDGFLMNPTGCGTKPFVVTFRSHAGATAQGQSSLTPVNCALLSFNPQLRLIVPVGSNTDKQIPGRSEHPSLRAIVTQASGQSAISRVRVLLPDPLRPDTVKLNEPGALCNDEQLARLACPAGSQVGSATAVTPLLPEPLSGPVYIVQELPQPIPKLAVVLGGRVSLQLNALNRIEGVRTANTFEGVPDVPVTRFELNIDGGKDGILFNFSDLCAKRSTFDARFDSHSGAAVMFTRDLEVPGCNGSITTSRVRMKSNGTVRVRVSCAGQRNCEGKLRLRAGSGGSSARKRRKRRSLSGTLASKSVRLAAGTRKTYRLRLSRKARRELRKHKRIRVLAQLRLERGQQALSLVESKRVTVLAPKKKKKKRSRR